MTNLSLTQSRLAALGICASLSLLAAATWWLWGDERTWGLMRQTLELALLSAAISLPLGALAALLLLRTDVPGRRFGLAVLALMLLVPLYLQVAGWDAGFGKQGWYSLFTESLARPPLHGLRGAVWVHAMAAVPWVALMVGVGLRYVEPELEEMALLEGGQAALVGRVLVPRILPALGAALLWVIVSTSAEMTVADMYLLPTYARELYTGTALGDSWASVAGQILPGVALVVALVAAALVVASFLAPPVEDTPQRPARPIRLGHWRGPAAVVMLLLVLLVAGVPLLNLAYKAGMVASQEGGERTRVWSAGVFVTTLAESPGRFADHHLWTFLIAGGTALVTLLFAIPLAWWARRPGCRALPALATAALGFALPAPLVALLLIEALDQPHLPWLIWLYDDTLFAPIAAMTIRTLPLTLLITWYGMRSLPRDVLDSALVDGAGPWRRLYRIVLPQRRSVWLLAGLLAFVLASGDLAATILVVPPGVMTIAIKVFGLIHAGVDDQVAGICLTTAAGYVLLAGLFLWLLRRQQRRLGI